LTQEQRNQQESIEFGQQAPKTPSVSKEIKAQGQQGVQAEQSQHESTEGAKKLSAQKGPKQSSLASFFGGIKSTPTAAPATKKHEDKPKQAPKRVYAKRGTK